MKLMFNFKLNAGLRYVKRKILTYQLPGDVMSLA